jgi:hypothetical protein
MLIQPPIDRWRYRNNQQGKPKDQQHGVDHIPHLSLPRSWSSLALISRSVTLNPASAMWLVVMLIALSWR